MSLAPKPLDPRGAGAHLAELAEGMGRLVVQHLELFKLELVAGLKATGGDVGKIAAAVPLLIIGYCFVCSGLAVVLARWLGIAGGLFAVGGAHLLIGGLIVWWGVARMNGRTMLPGTREELAQTSAVLSTSKEMVRGER